MPALASEHWNVRSADKRAGLLHHAGQRQLEVTRRSVSRLACYPHALKPSPIQQQQPALDQQQLGADHGTVRVEWTKLHATGHGVRVAVEVLLSCAAY